MLQKLLGHAVMLLLFEQLSDGDSVLMVQYLRLFMLGNCLFYLP